MLEILMLIVLIFLVQFLSNLIRVPFIIAILLFSALMGPNGFISKYYGINILDENSISIISQLGILMLLYLIGLQINLRDILVYNIKALGFFLFSNIFVAFLVYLLITSIIFPWLSKELAFIISITLSFTSTAIYYELAKDYKLHTKPESNLLLTKSIIEDIIALLILAFLFKLSNISITDISAELYNLFISGLIFLGLTVIVLLVASIFKDIINRNDISNGDDDSIKQIYFSFFMSILIVLLILAKLIDFPIGIAAFIAGSISSLFSREFQKIRDSIFLFSETFISIFLIYIGSQIDLEKLMDLSYWKIAGILMVVIVIAKTTTSIIYFRKLGYDTRNSFQITFLSLAVGEFTLIVFSELDKVFGLSLVNIGFILILSSVLISVGLMKISNIIMKTYDRFAGVRS
ncbi:MAG: cation:proton antiporter [Candidatus Micrarchaeota archaeon]|nr:cation:proton antiporter [Candidatus Micrarchaeota archaeon]MCX8154413.1 cation:proton antiporter [Candidatus Micrarchaeota archaeon]